MTPDDWHRAMCNEADAAPDPAWSSQTRRFARHARLGRRLLGHLLFGQTLFVAVLLLFFSPAEPGPWLALVALGLSFAALRRGNTGGTVLAVALAWSALASAPGAEALFGVSLPVPGLLLASTVAGLGALLYSCTGSRKMTP